MIKFLYKTLLPGLVAVVLLGSVAFSVNTPVASAQAMSAQQTTETIKQLQAQVEGRGYYVEITNMDVSDSGPRGDHGEFDIDFRIKAFTEDVFIPNSTARGLGSVGVIYEVVENGGRVVTTGQTTATLDSSARRDGSRYRVNEGESVDFELVVAYQPEYTGTYTVRLRTVRPEDDVATRMPDRDDRFEVKYITLKGSREIPGQTGQESNSETIQGLQQQLMALIAQLTQILANLQTQTLQPTHLPPVNNNLSASPTSGFAPLNVVFSIFGTDAMEIEFGDGTSEPINQGMIVTCAVGATSCPSQFLTHTYTSPGTYTARTSRITGVGAIPGGGGGSYSVVLGTATITVRDNRGPSITVTAPNNGAYWSHGGLQTVRWSTSNIASGEYEVRVRLRSVSTGREYNLGSGSNTAGQSTSFTVPTTIPVDAYYVEVKTSVNNVSYSDSSDQYIKIVDTTITSTIIPVVTTTGMNYTSDAALLAGYIDSKSAPVNARGWFEWGTTANLGNSTPCEYNYEGVTMLSCSANISGLMQNTMYYFRIVASGPQGNVYGNILSFRTSVATVTLTSPRDGATLKIGDTIPVSWSYLNAPLKSQVVVSLRLIQQASYSTISGVSGGSWQSPLLSPSFGVASLGNGSYGWTTGPGRVELPGLYEITANISDCDPRGCDYNSESARKIWAKSNPVRFTIDSQYLR